MQKKASRSTALTPVRREEMALAVISGHLSKAQAARVYGVSAKIVNRWTERYRAEGPSGMQDRSSRPKLIPTQTAEALAERIITHRRQRLCGRHIAELTGVSPATVSRVLRRAGLSRLRDLVPPEPEVRYAYKEPGGLTLPPSGEALSGRAAASGACE
jgi:transposase